MKLTRMTSSHSKEVNGDNGDVRMRVRMRRLICMYIDIMFIPVPTYTNVCASV